LAILTNPIIFYSIFVKLKGRADDNQNQLPRYGGMNRSELKEISRPIQMISQISDLTPNSNQTTISQFPKLAQPTFNQEEYTT